jgi:adenylate kinase family enzyme
MTGPRISIIGTSGSGKTTVAARAAKRLGLPHIELDAIRHGPNWTETPDAEFRLKVAAIAAGERWVIDGNYGVVRDIVWARATTVVWLDPPRAVVMAQVIWRSVTRAITREELWNGNRERFGKFLDADHPIRWAFSTHHARRAKFLEAMGPTWVRLRSRREIDAWLASLPISRADSDEQPAAPPRQ